MTDEPTPTGRFRWERLIRSANLAPPVKLVALTLATYANRDGSSAHPGVKLLADDCGFSEKSIRRHLAVLVRRGFIHKVRSGSAQGRRALADVWQLTDAGDADTFAPSASAVTTVTGDRGGSPDSLVTGDPDQEHRSTANGTPVNYSESTGHSCDHPPLSTSTTKGVTSHRGGALAAAAPPDSAPVDPLAHTCPHPPCRAPARKPCRNHRGAEREPHPSRVDRAHDNAAPSPATASPSGSHS